MFETLINKINMKTIISINDGSEQNQVVELGSDAGASQSRAFESRTRLDY